MFKILYQSLKAKQFLNIFMGLFLITSLEAVCTNSFSFNESPKYKKNFTNFAYVNPKANQGGKLKLSSPSGFTTLNPYGIIGILPKDYYSLYFDTLLFTPDDDINSFYPLLAEKICITTKENTLTFQLNKKAYWHDGSPITSKDVEFTLKTLKKTETSYYKEALQNVKEVIIINPHTIKIQLNKITKETFSLIVSLPILNKDYWINRDFIAPSDDIPISSGAYKIHEITFNKNIIFKKDPNYWGKNLPSRIGYFNFEEISYTYNIPKNKEDSLLIANKLHIKQENNPRIWTSKYSQEFLKTNNLIKLEVSHNRILEFQALFFNTRTNNLKNKNTRQALALTYNFEKINTLLFHNFYERTTSLFENSPFKGNNLAYIPSYTQKNSIFTNLKLADKLLNKDGFYLINNKRIHNKTNEILSLQIVFKNKDSMNNHLDFINNLKLLGIEVIAKYFNNTTYNKIKNNFDYDLIEASYLFSTPPANELLYYFKEPLSANYSGIDNLDINILLDEIVHHKNIIKNLQTLDTILFANYLFIPMYKNKYDTYIYKDIFEDPLISNLGLNIFTWSFKKEYINAN